MENRKYKYIYFGSNIESEIEFENLKEEKFDNPEVIRLYNIYGGIRKKRDKKSMRNMLS